MVCIFPLVFATVKRNLESRNIKTWEENCLPWRKKKGNNKFLKHKELKFRKVHFSMTVWGHIGKSIQYSQNKLKNAKYELLEYITKMLKFWEECEERYKYI